MKRLIQISLAACAFFSGLAAGQTLAPQQSSSTTLPEAPAPQSAQASVYQPKASDSYFFHVGVLCGVGASTSPAATKPSTGCGVGMMLLPVPVFAEVGVMGPQANRSNFSAYISIDGNFPLTRTDAKYLPSAILGYTRMFETGHALDYGLALALPRPGKPKDPSSSLRIELRDYWTFANPTQHNIQMRIGWMSLEAD